MGTVENEFPVWGLLPKKETGVVNFLNKYPDYDGRGTVIAIFDSGIDPGAPGLQETSDGKVKVIERFDCSGCGDVNMTTIVTPKEGYITGLTGRKIRIPHEWENPENKYRIGVKNAFDLYPDRLKDRVRQDYKKKYWDDGHKQALADVSRELAEFEAKHSHSSNLNDADKLIKENLEARLEVLQNFEKKYVDNGPVFDCILFHDGEKWLACVDTTDNGDVSKCPLLGEYSITHDYAPLTSVDNLNFSINVHNNGDVLELVGVCSSHGTHVASIASAYFPNSPEQNGVAPGAQIVSLTIGDGRLGSMETGTALVRAMIKVMELKKTRPIDVINMSYGEHAHWLDSGRVGELLNEVVNKYGIVWVASAGNNGPALGTISTPSDISQEPIISVGAYVSPDMMIAAYALPQKLPGAPYTWSSRGPTLDGGIGVHVCAPGGAITSVPNFTLRGSQLMNGTSMASPHVAGAVSLLISGMQQKGLPYTPYSIKKALENTAGFILGIEYQAQGNGLVQIDKAFEHLEEYYNVMEKNVRFGIQCGTSNAKGIYLRTKLHTHTHNYKITVEPHFLDSDNVPAQEKIKFHMKFIMSCDADYITYPTHLHLSNMSRMFAVKVDTSHLTEGVYSAYINAFDVACFRKGPVFKIPVTIIVPANVEGTNLNTVKYEHMNFKPNTIRRHYYVPPDNSTWAVLKLISDEDNGRYVIHTLQAMPKQCCKAMETSKTIAVTSTAESTVSFQVKGGVVLEVVIAKYWANFGEANLNYQITFYGIKPDSPLIEMHAADGVKAVHVRTLQGEEISPSVTLKNSVQIVKPAEAKIQPLTSRDVIPPFRQIYELVLMYNFNISKQCEVSPNFPLLSNLLYESEYESQFWFLYDNNKQLMGCGDAYPSKYSVKLEKGDYVIRMQIRHEKKDYLEKLNESPILLQQKLNNNITLDVYNSPSQALIAGKKVGIIQNPNPYTIIPLYIAPMSSDKFPIKSNNAAHYLTGYVTFAKDELGKKVDSYPVKYYLTDSSGSSNKKSNSNQNDKSKMEEYNDAIRDAKIQWLAKMDVATVDPLYESLVNEYRDYLPLYSAYLSVVDPLDKRSLPSIEYHNISIDVSKLNTYLEICNNVIHSIKEEPLLAYMAMKVDTRPDAAKIKQQMDQQKNILLECIARKGVILCRMKIQNLADKESINSTWKQLLKFVDPSDAKVLTSHVLFFAIWHAYINGHYGRLMKYLLKYQEDKGSKELEERIMEFTKQLHWLHVYKYLLRSLPNKYPTAYRPF